MVLPKRGNVMATIYGRVWKALIFGALLSAPIAGVAFGERGASLSSTRKLTVRAEGAEFVLNLNDRGATFAVSAPAQSAVSADAGVALSPVIYPSFAAAQGRLLPSLELCRWRGLAYEEGALAAVEFKFEEAVGLLASGRGGFLTALALKLKQLYEADDRAPSRVAFGDAQAFVATALALSRPDGKVPPELGFSSEVASKAAQDRERFLKEDIGAQVPAGRYLWDEKLQRVYVTSRWLARAFDRTNEREFKAAVALAWAVESDADLARQYRTLADLCNGLAGPPADSASVAYYYKLLGGRDGVEVLRELGTVRKIQLEAKEEGDAFVFLPAFGQADVELIRRFASRGGPREGTWAGDYAAAIREGATATAPARDGAWFDFMAYAWAAMLTPDATPEAAKISWDDGYKKRLAESYVTGFDQVRVRAPAATPPVATAEVLAVDVTPEFRLEPLPEYYLRMARAYARLEAVVGAALTPSVMESVTGRREGGAATASLAAEAADLRELFYGLYLLSCADAGMTPAVGYGEVPDRAAAATRAYEWLEKWRSDADMARDVRELWLLGPADPSDPAKGNVYRCVLGVRSLDVEVKYDKKPTHSLTGTARAAELHFKPVTYTVLLPIVVEVVVRGEKALTRAEFRKICDEQKTEGAIVAALKEFGKPKEPPPEEPTAPPEKEVDPGMVVLIGVLALFALVVIIALIAGRQRY